MKNRRIIFKNIDGGTDKPLFSLKDLNFGILCESLESKSIYWYDNMGSIGKFYNLLGCQKDESNQIETELNEKLNITNIDNILDLKEDLIDLLNLLPRSNYNAIYIESTTKNKEEGYNLYNTIFAKYDKSKFSESDLKSEFKNHFLQTIQKRKNYLPPKLIDFTSCNFYDGYETHIIATKHFDCLDKSRIEYYKKEIKNGKRPPIIVFKGCTLLDITNAFILDGHHKAQAYIETKMNPAVIEIYGDIEVSNTPIEDLIEVSDILYCNQMNYLLTSNYDFNEIKNQIILTKKLNKFIFNGQVEEYYPNDQLRFKGNYEHGKRDGIFTWYYPDGSLHKRVKYNLDQWITTYEEYFHNGRLLIKGDETGIKERYDTYGNPIK